MGDLQGVPAAFFTTEIVTAVRGEEIVAATARGPHLRDYAVAETPPHGGDSILGIRATPRKSLAGGMADKKSNISLNIDDDELYNKNY